MVVKIERAATGGLQIYLDPQDREMVCELPRDVSIADWSAVMGTALRGWGTDRVQAMVDAMALFVQDQRDTVAWIRKGEHSLGNARKDTETDAQLAICLRQYDALRAAVPAFDAQLRVNLEQIDLAAAVVAHNDAERSRHEIRATLATNFDVKPKVLEQLPDHTMWQGSPPKLLPTVAAHLQFAMADIDNRFNDWVRSGSGNGNAKTREAQRRSRLTRYTQYRVAVRQYAALDPVLNCVVPKSSKDAKPSIDERVFDALSTAWANTLALDEHIQRRSNAMDVVRARLDRAFEAEAKRNGVPRLVCVDAYRETLEGVADELLTGPFEEGAVVHHDGTGVWAYPALIQRCMNLYGIDEWAPLRNAADEVCMGPHTNLWMAAAEMLAQGGVGLLASGAGAGVGVAVEIISNGFLAARDLLETLERQARERVGAGFSLDPEDSYGPRLQAVSDAILGTAFVGNVFPYSHILPGRFGTLIGLVAPLAASWLATPSDMPQKEGASP